MRSSRRRRRSPTRRCAPRPSNSASASPRARPWTTCWKRPSPSSATARGRRRAAYNADIPYGTNNEFGFAYLRDNLVYEAGEMVQRGHNFAIVDEVDSILIDEARTPLIISGPTEDRSEFYKTIDLLVKELIQDKTTYDFDEKQRQVILTEEGSEKIEEMLMAGGHLAEDSAGL